MGLISAATTIFDGGSMSAGFGGSMTFIKKLTATNASTLSFVGGASGVVLDGTYKKYVFKFKDIHTDTDNGGFNFQCSIDAGSNYNVATTSTAFRAEHNEGDNDTTLAYRRDDNWDQGNGTAFQRIIDGTGNAADESGAGTLNIYNPSSTTFVKHWNVTSFNHHGADYEINYYFAGFFNTTSAINAVRFSTFSGTFDGDICLYGIA
tara:strand:- start:17 stop:634 length:618 start_codon:yes stop_codon:yes gene_type:complete